MSQDKILKRLKNYYIYKQIGSGYTSTVLAIHYLQVYEAYDSLKDRKVAIKKIMKDPSKENAQKIFKPTNPENFQKFVQNEKAILYNYKENSNSNSMMLQIRQNNIIEILDSITTADAYYIVLELCDKSLKEMMEINTKKNIYLSETDAIKLLQQIITGMIKLHDNFICHRDLKPANILLKKNSNNEYEVKISDFGFAKFQSDELFKTILGTPGYMAPEMKSHYPYNPKLADMYSLGVIFYEMLFNKKYQGELYFQRNPSLKTTTQNIIGQMLIPNPQKRIGWEKLINDLYASNDFEYSQNMKEYFYHKFENKIKFLENTINEIVAFAAFAEFAALQNKTIYTQQSEISLNEAILVLMKKKHYEITKKMEEPLTDIQRGDIEKRRQQALSDYDQQTEKMKKLDYIFKTDLLNKEYTGRDILKLQNYSEELERINNDIQLQSIELNKQQILDKEEYLKRLTSLQLQLKMAQDFDHDFVNVFGEVKNEKFNILLQQSQTNLNKFQQFFNSMSLQTCKRYLEIMSKNIQESQVIPQESQVMLQEQN